MVLCPHFRRGNCHFGSQCVNEHPGKVTQYNAGPAATFSVEGIRSDLTTERPLYALTCYAAAKGEPNLIGEQDESPEELRWRFYQARIQNNPGLYPEQDLINKSEAAVQKILGNLNSAFQYATTLTNSNPTITTTSAFSQGGATPQAFGGGGAFGSVSTARPNAFSASPATSAFGGGTFGAVAAPKTSAFGSGGALGNSAFGATSTLPVTAFGAAAATSGGFGAFSGNSTAAPIAGSSAFGQAGFGTAAPTSAFGAPAFGKPSTSSAFGAPAFGQPTAAPTFGSSAFGGPAATSSAFGGSTFGGSAFGAASQPSAVSAFGQPAFGATAAPASGGGGFGAFSGGAAAKPTAFGGGGSAFGSGGVIQGGGGSAFGSGGVLGTPPPAAAVPSAFGSGNAFGGSSAGGFGAFGSAPGPVASNPFGAPAAFGASPTAAPSAFSVFGQSSGSPSAFSQPSAPSTFGQPTTTSTFGQPSAFSLQRSPFASAPVPLQQQPRAQASPGKLQDPFAALATLESALSELDLAAFQATTFNWGEIPLVAPPVALR